MAGVRRCVWLQDDPLIKVKIMKEVSERDGSYKTSTARAQDVCADFRYCKQLDDAYVQWKETARKGLPFFMRESSAALNDEDEDSVSRSTTVPTFLCTDDALDVFEAASKHFVNTCREVLDENKDEKEGKQGEGAASVAVSASAAQVQIQRQGSLTVPALVRSKSGRHAALQESGHLRELARHLRTVCSFYLPLSYSRGAHHT